MFSVSLRLHNSLDISNEKQITQQRTAKRDFLQESGFRVVLHARFIFNNKIDLFSDSIISELFQYFMVRVVESFCTSQSEFNKLSVENCMQKWHILI